jgi:hypothetical protein
MQTVSLIMRKISIYGDSFFTSESLTNIALYLYSGNTESVNPLELVRRHFHCELVELWHFDVLRGTGQRYDPILHEMVNVGMQNHGISKISATEKRTINCPNVQDHPTFSEEIDDIIEGPVLIVTMDIGRRDTWVVALRGHSKPFNTANESQLNAILPFIVMKSRVKVVMRVSVDVLLSSSMFIGGMRARICGNSHSDIPTETLEEGSESLP